MMRRRPLLILAIVALGGMAGVFGFRVWLVQATARRERQALAQAEGLLRAGKPAEALAVADTFAGNSKDPVWFRVQLQAATRSQNIPRLALLFDHFPGEVLKEEDASLALARGFLQADMRAGLDRVRSAWKGRERHPEAWRLLDADGLLISGKGRQAEKLLAGGPPSGAGDAPRLVRLALVTAERDLAGACKLLDQAVALDPTNCIARWSRGEILERMGRVRLARVEFASALASEPANWYWRDQLAEFYMRLRNDDLALDTWSEAPARPRPDFIQLKVEFFNRVLRPGSPGAAVETAPGELEPLVRFVEGLKPGRFFDSEAFNQLPDSRAYAAQRPEVYWLRVLDDLQTGAEAAAFDRITADSSRLRSWDPELADALERVLCFRRSQRFFPAGIGFGRTGSETNRPPLFALLERAARQELAAADHKPKLSPDFAALLRGSNIFSQIFLTAGWREAALQLRRSPRVTPGEPDSLCAAYAEALSLNRNSRAALDFLGTDPLPPASALVRAELLVESGRRDEARANLRALAKLNSPAGVRASSMLALDAIEGKDYAAARRWVAEQPLLAQADLGKEILARIALADNRTAEAEVIYRGILNSSIEAKTWFARKAFAEQKWDEARRIVNESLNLIPDSPQLHESLAAIDRAQAAAKPHAPL